MMLSKANPQLGDLLVIDSDAMEIEREVIGFGEYLKVQSRTPSGRYVIDFLHPGTQVTVLLTTFAPTKRKGN